MIFNKWVSIALPAALLAAAPLAHAELVFSGVSSTSDDYALGVVWSGVSKTAGVPMTVVENGTVAGMRKAAQGEVDIVSVGSPHYLDAVAGQGAYKADPAELREKYKSMKVIFSMPSGMAQYVVRADSKIKKFADLDGKKIGIGRPGGNAGQISKVLFKLHKVNVDGQFLEYGAALEQLASGSLDGTLVWGSVPTAAIDNASRGTKLRVISPDVATLAQFRSTVTNGNYYVYQKVSADLIAKSYDGRVEVDAAGARFWTFPWQIMVRDGVDDETVYKITKAFWNNLSKVQQTSAALSLISIDDALDGTSGTVHPGAVRFYREVGKLK